VTLQLQTSRASFDRKCIKSLDEGTYSSLVMHLLYLLRVLTSFNYDRGEGVKATPAQLTDVCFVIDALGYKERREFITWFCEQRLRKYTAIFPTSEGVRTRSLACLLAP